MSSPTSAFQHRAESHLDNQEHGAKFPLQYSSILEELNFLSSVARLSLETPVHPT